ncbi:hypothetical protein B7494_g4073 [Chlorociboria aeruginascens]|nr:hypothetical protein B7494_g4073 [Chlorociboria aeruginascens]
MSSSITIPSRPAYGESSQPAASSSSTSSYSSSPHTPQSTQSSPASPNTRYGHDRRRSLLSSSLSKQEHTVINIGDPDGTPRLVGLSIVSWDERRLLIFLQITCVKSSQGFDWNPEIFLPSYIENDFESLERKRDPIHEILLSDEESKELLPQ